MELVSVFRIRYSVFRRALPLVNANGIRITDYGYGLRIRITDYGIRASSSLASPRP
jgi:hypothetical protein